MFIVQRREPSSLCANTLPFAHYPPPTPRRLRTCEYNTSGLDKIRSMSAVKGKKSSRQQAPIAKGRAAGAAERPVGIEPIQGKINDGSRALCRKEGRLRVASVVRLSVVLSFLGVPLDTGCFFSVFCLLSRLFCLLSRWFVSLVFVVVFGAAQSKPTGIQEPAGSAPTGRQSNVPLSGQQW